MRIHEIDKASSFPPIISAHDLVSLVREWHHTPQDFEDGDLFQNITSFETYRLKMIPIETLELDMFYIDDDLVDDYASRKSTAPPIVYNPVNDVIIDGNHRANAAARRRETKILAYVGDPSTYTPVDEDDD